MLRDSVATESINVFAQGQADVSPEEPIFVLPGSQLQEIVFKAVQDALESQKSLREIVQDQAKEIGALNARLEVLQKDMDSLADNQLNQLRLIADLRKREPGKTEVSRAEKIARYLEARPDHKATFETLKGHLGIDKDLLHQSIKNLMISSPGRYGIVRTPGDKRKRTLVMLPK
jgi:hypothetical protein